MACGGGRLCAVHGPLSPPPPQQLPRRLRASAARPRQLLRSARHSAPWRRQSAPPAARATPRASLRDAAAAWLWRLLDGPPPAPDPAALQLSAPDAAQQPSAAGLELATFAAGCFWGLEAALAVPGVRATQAGYTQGRDVAPSYARVAAGRSGHVEAVRCEFAPAAVSYDALLAAWWDCLADASDARGQGQDRGPQYRPGVFWHSEQQRDAAQRFLQRKQAERGARQLAVLLKPAAPFYVAEECHQQYLAKGERKALQL